MDIIVAIYNIVNIIVAIYNIVNIIIKNTKGETSHEKGSTTLVHLKSSEDILLYSYVMYSYIYIYLYIAILLYSYVILL